MTYGQCLGVAMIVAMCLVGQVVFKQPWDTWPEFLVKMAIANAILIGVVAWLAMALWLLVG